MKMNRKCFMEFNNKVYAIQNWHLRNNEDDVILLDPLDTQELGKHSELSKQGRSEEHIFNVIYPRAVTKPKAKVLIDIDMLTKDQLLHLIRVGLNISVPSLMYMSTDDLQELYLAISANSGLPTYAYLN
jgi:hypothetical protein